MNLSITPCAVALQAAHVFMELLVLTPARQYLKIAVKVKLSWADGVVESLACFENSSASGKFHYPRWGDYHRAALNQQAVFCLEIKLVRQTTGKTDQMWRGQCEFGSLLQ